VQRRETVSVSTTINGRAWQGDIAASEVLSDLLRERVGLTGTKVSCASEVCGACTVLVDDMPVSSCTMLALEVRGRSVTTVEGLASGAQLDPLQEAFVRNVATQCGFCTPGQLMAAKSLLSSIPRPTEAEIAEHMRGNICRCGCYPAIARSIKQVSTSRADAPEGT
jgi:aerobic-type carbon monoxide dehydrogenase small subunit (CoxS/CutS family)